MTCRRGGRTLFANLDLDLEPGTLLWLRGANGVGKTSLLRLLAGLAAPDAGTVRRGPVIFIGHNNALAGDLTLAENLACAAALEGRGQRGAAEVSVRAALEVFGLTQQVDLPARRLSQGQQRRAALARLALDDTPRAWLLDEPHDAIDADGVETLNAMLVANAARGGAVVLTGHQALSLPGQSCLHLGRSADT